MTGQNKETFADEAMAIMRTQFGDAIKGYWVYVDDLCPCCGTRPIDAFQYKHAQTLSLNGFMYRAHGVLISYLLCGECAQAIMQLKPMTKSPMHTAIETNLIAAYKRHLAALDA